MSSKDPEAAAPPPAVEKGEIESEKKVVASGTDEKKEIGSTTEVETPAPVAGSSTAEASATPGGPPAVQGTPIIDAPVIEAEDFDEHDSSYGGDDGGSDLNYGSITSSILDYRKENGRTYHAYSDGKYLVPNDEREQERLDMAYHSLLLMFDGKAFFAPVENPQRILDVGTGTGIWALDVGDQFPAAHVIGIDLSPIQPKWVAPNVEFRVDDLEHQWVYETPFDLIHSRLCSGNAIKDYRKFLSNSYQHLKPGGWLEGQEYYMDVLTDDDTLPPNSKLKEWHDLSVEGAAKAGHFCRIDSKTMKGWFEEAGFVNVHVVDLKWPIGPWPAEKRLKEAGAFAMISMLEELAGLSLAVFTRILGWTKEELELFLVDVKKEWKTKGIHAYWPIFVIYGQKPFEKEEEEYVAGT